MFASFMEDFIILKIRLIRITTYLSILSVKHLSGGELRKKNGNRVLKFGIGT